MGDPLLDRVYPAQAARWIRALVGAVALVRTVTLVPQLQRAADSDSAVPLLWGGVVNAATWWVIAGLWVAAALALVVGVRTRLAAGVLALLVAVVLGADAGLLWNHLYVLGLASLVLAVAGDELSGSPLRAGDGGWVSGWPFALIRLQVTIVYLFAGIAKINEDFLSGLVLYESLSAGVLTSWAPTTLVSSQPFLTGISVAVIAVELWFAAALWVRRWFGWNFSVAIALHASMILLAQHGQQLLQLTVFAVLMWALLLAFKEPLPRTGPPMASGSRVAAERA